MWIIDGQIKELPVSETQTTESPSMSLILWNDDVNTFDFVIESLVDICEHDALQAEQCAYIVHFNGRCNVKKGPEEELQSQCGALCNRGLTASVE